MLDPASNDPPGQATNADEVERDRFLARYRPWLELLARAGFDRRRQGPYSASDVVQQTLLEAWRDWGQFRGQATAQRLAWLRQILAHQLARHERLFVGTKKRDPARERSLAATLDQSSLRLEALLPAGDPSPSEEAVQREEQLRLARALARLPEDYRTVIVLRSLQELPHEEVACQMNRSPGAVRMLWLRALAELRKEWEDSKPDGEGPIAGMGR